MGLPESIRLYGILDLDYVTPAEAPRMAESLISGGAGILQLRAKKRRPEEIADLARELAGVCHTFSIPFVINDYAALAAEVGGAGVHLGQDDTSVEAARDFLGPQAIIGLSTHNLSQARAAMERPVDYIGFGPLFATQTKPDYTPIGLSQIGEVHAFSRVPVFCIGGIKRENLGVVTAAGARRVVIVSGLLQAENPTAYARDCVALLDQKPV